jgi:DNA-binding CsgD family transcriptional regulator
MSWQTLDPLIREIAERECTDKELHALRLWHNGHGYQTIGRNLGISVSSARGRIQRALDRIEIALRKEHGGYLTHSVREPNHQTPQS